MPAISSVAVIGAGPYGLSIAAHLRAKGIEAHVFGAPMDTWGNGMPRGMRLKSEAFASCLSDPAGSFTLRAFCLEQGLPYADVGFAVPVETFTAYGTAFAARFVPQLDRRRVRRLHRMDGDFRLDLDDGAAVTVRRVIVATGIGPYRHVPAVFAGLPAARLTHTADLADYSRFAGQRVVVVGAGASAIDAAAALQRAGAAVRLVSRRDAITFHAAGRRRWFERVTAPLTPLGPGWKKLLCTRAPLLFRLLPEHLRVSLVRRHLGPAPGWSARADFEGKVEVTLRAAVAAARLTDRGVELDLAAPEGARTLEPADHVVVGTGYSIDVAALPFLDPALLAGLDLAQGAPRLSSHFESSVPGLYFAGTAAANTFGPLLRFVCGAGFAARRIAAHAAAGAVAHVAAPVTAPVVALGAATRTRAVPLPSAVRVQASAPVASRPRPSVARQRTMVPVRRRPPAQPRSASPEGARPRVLFVSLMNDVGSDRIVAAMGRLGCACAVLAPPDAFAARSRFAAARFALPRRGGAWVRNLRLAGRLARAARDWRPDLIVPLDDCSAGSLRNPRLLAQVGFDLARLIEVSLGDPAHFPTVNGREALVEAAAALGLRTPRQAKIAGWEEARSTAAAFGYPVVLKREQTCGGFGVDIVGDEASLAQAFTRARRKAVSKRLLQSALGLGSAGGNVLILQSYVPGPLAFRTVACSRGRVLDGVSFTADTIHPPVTGASTVLRPLRQAEMEAATRALVARLGCSGFVSVDFILSGEGATVIELNPRPVISGHLGRLYGHDIYAALVASLTDTPSIPSTLPVAPLREGPAAVALFPRELDRDPESPVLDAPSAVLHDVPWDDVDVLAHYAAWLERRHATAIDCLRRHLPPTGAPGRDATGANSTDTIWRGERATA